MASKRLHELLPVGSLLLAATMWGLLWFPLRLLQDGGLDGVWTTLIAYGAALVVIGLPLLWRERSEYRRHFAYLVILALVSGWCNLAFILAMLDGTVVRVLLLFYLSPLWAVLLGRVILGEKMSHQAMIVLALAMIGALMMLWDPALGFPWPQTEADWMAISSGFAFALSNVLIRKNQAVSISNKAISAWWGGIILAGGWLLASGAEWPQVQPDVVFAAAALGVFGLALATYAVQFGVTHMPVHRSAVILLFELIIGAISAELLTDEVVRAVEWIGGAFILAAAWLTAKRQEEG